MKMKILVEEVGGGVGGLDDFTMPDFNLADLQGETPEWLKWIADNKEMVLGFLARFSNVFKIIRTTSSRIWRKSGIFKSIRNRLNGMAE